MNFTPHVGQRVACITDKGVDMTRLATILRCRKRAHTVTNLYVVTVREDNGEQYDSVNGCWHPIDLPIDQPYT